MVGNLIGLLVLLEIYCSLQQWKRFANPPRIDKVIAMVRVAPFLTHGVYILSQNMSLLCLAYIFDIHKSILMIFGRNVSVKLGNKRYFIFPSHLKVLMQYLHAGNRKTRKLHLFTRDRGFNDCPWPRYEAARGYKIAALALVSKRSGPGLDLEDHWPSP